MIIKYHPKVLDEDIPSLDKAIAIRIKNAIEKRLMTEPLKYGDYLHGSLKGYRKYRVDDHRIVYRIAGNEIHILVIGKRKDDEVYGIANRRNHNQVMEKPTSWYPRATSKAKSARKNTLKQLRRSKLR
jgi:mRNA interferase RelE/StbE